MPPKSKTPKTLANTLKSISPIPGTPGGPGGIGSPGSPMVSEYRSAGLIVAMIIGLIGLIINVNAILWIYKLENIPECKCSDNWMRMYLKYYLFVVIPVVFIQFFINMYLFMNDLRLNDITGNLMLMFRVFVGFVNFMGFLNIIIAIIFISKLKEINCECSEDIRREVYFIYNIVLASFIGLALLGSLMSIPIAIMSLRK
jgi:hypothetical protein